MSNPITIEDIYQIFRTSQEEADRRHAELERIFVESKTESDRRHAELERMFVESKAESDRRHAELERMFVESKAESDRRAAEADRRAAEADRRLEKLERSVERTTKAVDNLTTRWGRFVEELVEPAVLQLFQEKGINVQETYPRAKVTRPGVAMEIDILAVDDTDVVLVECKSRLSQDDVDEFMERLTKFKEAFPRYKNHQAYGAVAGIEINENVARYAYQKGLFVIKPSGNTVTVINDNKFQPRTW